MNLKKILLLIFILVLLSLFFLTYSMQRTKGFNLDNEWTIHFPQNWVEEIDEVDGHHIYYPPDSDLTFRIVNFHFVKDEVNGRVEVPFFELFELFETIVRSTELELNTKVSEKKLNLNKIKIKNPKMKCYEYSYYENYEKVYAVSCGIAIDGYLLIVNIYSASKEEVEKAIKYIYSIKKYS